MRTKLVAALVGLLLIGGAAVAYGQEATDDSSTDTGRVGGWLRHHRGDIVESVLADLVEEGVIDQSQFDSIVAALEAKRAEYQDALDLLESFWEDGVLTAAEISQLPEPNPFTDADGPFGEALEDGELSRDEVEEIREAGREHRQELRDLVEGFLEDEVITAAEIARLPEPHPFNADGPFAEALEDGQLTRDEIKELRPHRPGHGSRGFGGGEVESALGA